MPYATQQDLERRYGAAELVQLTDRQDPGDGAPDAAVIETALADADALIDSYLAVRYALPLAAPPARLTQAAAVLAWYLLHRDRAPEEVRIAYDRELRWLQHVAEGKAELIGPDGDHPPTQGGSVQVCAPGRTFSRETLRGF